MKIQLFTFFIFLFSVLQNIFADSWIQKNPIPISSSRSTAASFSLGNFGYISCGDDSNGVFYNDLWRYDPSMDSWTQKANLPGVARDLTCGFSISSKGYVFGGRDINDNALGDLYEYDPTLNSWTSKTNSPTPRELCSAFVISDKAYVGFGIIDDFNLIMTSSWMRFDPVANSWTSIAAFPGSPRYGGIGLSINGKGYAGMGTDQNIGYTDWFEYDTINNNWNPKTSYPTFGVAAAFSFAIDSFGYVCTGENINNDVDDLWMYNSTSNSWLMKANFGGGIRAGGYCFVINDSAYAGGGINFDTDVEYRDLWLYDPSGTSDISEAVSTDRISIYPNPTFGVIHFKGIQNGERIKVTIYNSLGQIKYEFDSYYLGGLNLPELTGGIYTILINEGNKSDQFQLIVN